MCARLPREARPHAPWSARVVFVCAGGRERDGGDAPPAGTHSPSPPPRPGRAGVAEPPPEQLRPRPLLGPRARGGGSAAGPLEEGSLAGERREGARVSSLGCEGGGRAPGGPYPVHSRRAGTPSIWPRPSFSRSPVRCAHPGSSPTALDSGEDGCGCPRRPAPLRRGGFMPSIQALRPQPLMNLRGRAGPGTAPAQRAKARQRLGPSRASPISPRSEVFRGRSLQ